MRKRQRKKNTKKEWLERVNILNLLHRKKLRCWLDKNRKVCISPIDDDSFTLEKGGSKIPPRPFKKC